MKWNTVIFQWINIFWHPLLICPHWPSSPNDTQTKNGSACNRPCCKWSWSQLIKDRLSCFPTRQLIITIRSLRDFETSSKANRFLMFLEDDSGGVLLHCQTSQIKNNVYNLGTTFNKMTVWLCQNNNRGDMTLSSSVMLLLLKNLRLCEYDCNDSCTFHSRMTTFSSLYLLVYVVHTGLSNCDWWCTCVWSDCVENFFECDVYQLQTTRHMTNLNCEF